MSYRIAAAIDGDLITKLSQIAGVRAGRSAETADVRFSSADQVSRTLNSGGRKFAQAFANLNKAGNFVAVGIDVLQRLDKIVGSVIQLAEKGARPGLGGAERANISAEYRRLGGDFNRLVEAAADTGDFDPLSETDIENVLINVGLDKERSIELASMFRKLVVVEGSADLANDDVKEPRPIKALEESAGDPVANVYRYDSVFETGRAIKSRDDARVLAADARYLRKNIRKNIATLQDVTQNIVDNMELVRSTALAMLDGSRDPRVLSLRDAQSVAEAVRGQMLAKGSSPFLSQAGNIDSIFAATLISDDAN